MSTSCLDCVIFFFLFFVCSQLGLSQVEGRQVNVHINKSGSSSTAAKREYSKRERTGQDQYVLLDTRHRSTSCNNINPAAVTPSAWEHHVDPSKPPSPVSCCALPCLPHPVPHPTLWHEACIGHAVPQPYLIRLSRPCSRLFGYLALWQDEQDFFFFFSLADEHNTAAQGSDRGFRNGLEKQQDETGAKSCDHAAVYRP